ncbi:MAG: GntR family transcriptional regulator [Conexibacter sp.]|nr:GntR family transcriptional regulator [Conexibacter sp.]
MARTGRALMRQAYDEIKRRIITLELKPGYRIDDVALASDLRLSRTPVREALFLLGSEGLIEMRDRGGFAVRALDLADIADLFEVHVVIAKAVARVAVQRATDADLDAMTAAAEAVESAIDRRDHLEITRANAQLHRLEAGATHNEQLHQIATKIHDQGERLAYLCFGGEREWGQLDEYFTKVKLDHAALLAGYRRRDVAVVQKLATEHVQQFLERVQAWMASEATDGFVVTDADLDAGRFRRDTLSPQVD